MFKFYISVISALVILSAIACGNSSSSHFQLRIYDMGGQSESEVIASDVLRGSARVDRMPGASAGLYFRLTEEGQAKFRRLTRAVARRGARLHRLQRIAFEINGKVYARLSIDYRLFPDGDNAPTGLEIGGLDLRTAQRLAEQMRNS